MIEITDIILKTLEFENKSPERIAKDTLLSIEAIVSKMIEASDFICLV